MVEGMQFDAGTWWLAGLLLTALIGVAGALLSRSIFKRMDENSADTITWSRTPNKESNV